MNKVFLRCFAVLVFPICAFSATFTVINTNDAGAGSFRQAILDNNATAGGTNLVQFNIPGPGVQTIAPLSELPAITVPVLINGFTQPGASANTLTNGNNAVLKIRLDGSSAPGIYGLIIGASGSTVRGLVVVNFRPAGIGIVLRFGTGSAVEGCFVGIEADGSTVAGNAVGIIFGSPDGVSGPSTGCLVGGNTPGARNVISGNEGFGVGVSFVSNRVAGNYIGTDASGMFPRRNRGGILVSGAFSIIGGTNALERNVIGDGVILDGAEFATCFSNHVIGNYIGVNAAGTAALSEAQSGVFIANASASFIGGATPGAGNVISGHGGAGVSVNFFAPGIVIQGNRIGTSADGMSAIANEGDGVEIVGGQDTVVGGANAGEGNQISGNWGNGISISSLLYGPTRTRVQGNLIGTDATGLGALRNENMGVYLAADQNMVGGTNGGEGNIIAFNFNTGMAVVGASRTNNVIRHNSIHSNGGLGIDLGGGGVTLNDLNDTDSGANSLQNFPVLVAATNSATNITIVGMLNSGPNKTFGLDFFASRFCDPSGFGEGQQCFASRTVTTDASGNANFLFNFARSTFDVLVGRYITATASDSNNTSAFSPCLPVADAAHMAISAIVTNGAKHFQISWPRVAQDCVLQTATNLNPPIAWFTVTNGITQNNLDKTHSITNGLADLNRFFRLLCP